MVKYSSDIYKTCWSFESFGSVVSA